MNDETGSIPHDTTTPPRTRHYQANWQAGEPSFDLSEHRHGPYEEALTGLMQREQPTQERLDRIEGRFESLKDWLSTEHELTGREAQRIEAEFVDLRGRDAAAWAHLNGYADRLAAHDKHLADLAERLDRIERRDLPDIYKGLLGLAERVGGLEADNARLIEKLGELHADVHPDLYDEPERPHLYVVCSDCDGPDPCQACVAVQEGAIAVESIRPGIDGPMPCFSNWCPNPNHCCEAGRCQFSPAAMTEHTQASEPRQPRADVITALVGALNCNYLDEGAKARIWASIEREL